MPRGVTLGECLEQLRFEAGHSPSPALGKNAEPALKALLRRTQTTLWSDYHWSFMEVERTLPLQAGERYYAFPDDLDGTRVVGAHVRWSGQWKPLCFGITNADYNAMDPLANQRNNPAIKWDWRKNVEEDDEQLSGQMFEVWPLPDVTGDPADGGSEGTFKFTGIRTLRPFIANADKCDLDDYLIVLFAAAKLLGRQKLADGQEALSAAQNYYMRLRGQQDKQRMFILAGDTGDDSFALPEHVIHVSYAKAPP